MRVVPSAVLAFLLVGCESAPAPTPVARAPLPTATASAGSPRAACADMARADGLRAEGRLILASRLYERATKTCEAHRAAATTSLAEVLTDLGDVARLRAMGASNEAIAKAYLVANVSYTQMRSNLANAKEGAPRLLARDRLSVNIQRESTGWSIVSATAARALKFVAEDLPGHAGFEVEGGWFFVDLRTKKITEILARNRSFFYRLGGGKIAFQEEGPNGPDGKIVVYDTVSGARVHVGADPDPDGVGGLGNPARGARVAWPTPKGVAVYDATTDREVSLGEHVHAPLITLSEGAQLLRVEHDLESATGISRELFVWKIDTGEKLVTLHLGNSNWGYDFAMAPNGSYVAWIENGALRGFDVRTKSTFTFTTPKSCAYLTDPVFSGVLLVTTNTSRLAVVSPAPSNDPDNHVPKGTTPSFCIFDAKTHALLRAFRRADDEGIAAFSADGATLTIGHNNGSTIDPITDIDVATGKRRAWKARVPDVDLEQASDTAPWQVVRPGVGEGDAGGQREVRSRERRRVPGSLISADGAFVANGGTLWDARTGSIIWRASPDETVPPERAFGDAPPPRLYCVYSTNRVELELCADRLRPL